MPACARGALLITHSPRQKKNRSSGRPEVLRPSAEGVDCRDPRGLKPVSLSALDGTAEALHPIKPNAGLMGTPAVPFPKPPRQSTLVTGMDFARLQDNLFPIASPHNLKELPKGRVVLLFDQQNVDGQLPRQPQ